MELVFRPARAEDASLLAAAEREVARVPGQLVSQPEELADQRFTEKIEQLGRADNGYYAVAELEGQIVGHGMLDPLLPAAVRHVVHLTLVTHAGWQNQGVGKALLRHLIDWAESSDTVEKIELHVRSSNPRAIALYQKLGFREVGRYTRRVKIDAAEYVDDVAMERFV